jgi:hypothetical protein
MAPTADYGSTFGVLVFVQELALLGYCRRDRGYYAIREDEHRGATLQANLAYSGDAARGRCRWLDRRGTRILRAVRR